MDAKIWITAMAEYLSRQEPNNSDEYNWITAEKDYKNLECFIKKSYQCDNCGTLNDKKYKYGSKTICETCYKQKLCECGEMIDDEYTTRINKPGNIKCCSLCYDKDFCGECGMSIDEVDDNCLHMCNDKKTRCTDCLEFVKRTSGGKRREIIFRIGEPILYYNMPPPLTQEQINKWNEWKAMRGELPLTNEKINRMNKYRKKKE
tara:strand:+ start:72 stop:683 length:612 start_codon:yes stop_codon:yes gene_type:complete